MSLVQEVEDHYMGGCYDSFALSISSTPMAIRPLDFCYFDQIQ
jgi:hypothetical protein